MAGTPHYMRSGTLPTQSEINFALKKHFNMKMNIDAMPRGPARTNKLRRWNYVGYMIDKIINAKYAKRLERGRAPASSNRTRPNR